MRTVTINSPRCSPRFYQGIADESRIGQKKREKPFDRGNVRPRNYSISIVLKMMARDEHRTNTVLDDRSNPNENIIISRAKVSRRAFLIV